MELTLDRVYQAAHVLKPVIHKTDLVHATRIQTDCDLYLKTENLQNTGSFKIRGAYFKISTLSEEERKKRVVACSAGNHAQGVALAAQASGTKSTIFLPAIAPISKVEATRSYGASVKMIDGVYDDAYEAAVKFQEEHGSVFIHPFNDVDVMAGQGTIGMEILDQLEDADAVVVPVGGGAASMVQAVKDHHLESLEEVHTFADGIAVKSPGSLSYAMVEKYVDELVTVTDDETAAAILTLMERQKIVSEGAGAVSVAAVLFNKIPVKGKKVVAVISGGNIDVNILARVINRGLLKTGRKASLTIPLLDKPGQLEEVSKIIAEQGANVTKVDHNINVEDSDINGCHLTLQIDTRDFAHIEQIKQAFIQRGFTIL